VSSCRLSQLPCVTTEVRLLPTHLVEERENLVRRQVQGRLRVLYLGSLEPLSSAFHAQHAARNKHAIRTSHVVAVQIRTRSS